MYKKQKLSVIIPVYNIESYIGRCIKSVQEQEYENIDIILIDDGSKDDSGIICDEYANHDKRIKVIHKENEGLSAARNSGIVAADGEYVVFIDGDDFIEKGMFQELMLACNNDGVDVSLCHHQDDYANVTLTTTKEMEAFYCTGREALAFMLQGGKIPGTACAKIIKKTIIDGLLFPVGKTYEDAFFNTDLFLKAKTVYCTTKPYYHYWHRAGSITTKKFSESNFDIIDAYEMNLKKIRINAPELEDLALFRYYWAHCVVLDKMLLTDDYKALSRYDEIRSFVKMHWSNIVNCKSFSLFRRLSIVIFRLNISLYRRIVIIKNKYKGVNG